MAAIDDHMAAASLGIYPTPTPTDAERAAYFASLGLLGTLPNVVLSEADERGLTRLGLGTILD